MLCKFVKEKKVWWMITIVGIISLVFGIVCYKGLPADAHNMSMLMGMFTGLGSAFVVIGIVKLIHYKRTPADKLKIEQIELNDERNIQVLRGACTIANTVATILFAVMAFVFVALGYRIPAFISIGAMYIQLLVFIIGYRYFNSKM